VYSVPVLLFSLFCWKYVLRGIFVYFALVLSSKSVRNCSDAHHSGVLCAFVSCLYFVWFHFFGNMCYAAFWCIERLCCRLTLLGIVGKYVIHVMVILCAFVYCLYFVWFLFFGNVCCVAFWCNLRFCSLSSLICQELCGSMCFAAWLCTADRQAEAITSVTLGNVNN
jgi:hypothetical protein